MGTADSTENQEDEIPLSYETAQLLHGVGIDWFLQRLVGVVNAGSVSFGITLHVGGTLVTGQLIGGKAYFEDFGTKFGQAVGSAGGQAVSESFKSLGEIYDRPEEQDGQNQYIHIREAKFLPPGGQAWNHSAGFWRGKISAVAGFTLGELIQGSSSGG